MDALTTYFIVLYILLTTTKAIFLMLSAKYFGKINNANFPNTLSICLLSDLIIIILYGLLFWSVKDSIKTGAFLLNTHIWIWYIGVNLIMFAPYILLGKFIWSCTFIQSIKANIVWIISFVSLFIVSYTFLVIGALGTKFFNLF